MAETHTTNRSSFYPEVERAKVKYTDDRWEPVPPGRPTMILMLLMIAFGGFLVGLSVDNRHIVDWNLFKVGLFLGGLNFIVCFGWIHIYAPKGDWRRRIIPWAKPRKPLGESSGKS